MRKTKRFTPTVLDRFERVGRGKGIFNQYVPWHRVSRSDPSSRGRSHLISWQKEARQKELLSDGELLAITCISMLPNLIDVREQYPLSLDDSEHEGNDYLFFSDNLFAGTLSLANKLNIKHPQTNGNGTQSSWVMSTDMLVALYGTEPNPYLLAISVKLEKPIPGSREYALLKLEREYWSVRNVIWLLITPDLYKITVAKTLIRNNVWMMTTLVKEQHLSHIRKVLNTMKGVPLSIVLKNLATHFSSMEVAQHVFWGAVKEGVIPLDLDRSWRPYDPINLLDIESFWDQNPIYARKSSWI